MVARFLRLALGLTAPRGPRERRLAKLLQSVGAGFLGRGFGFLVTLASVPLAVGYLGQEQYGLWVGISAVMAWLSFADLGLGNGLTNVVSSAYGHDNPAGAREAVASVFWLLVLIAVTGIAVALASPTFVNWGAVLAPDQPALHAVLTDSVVVALVVVLAGLPLSVTSRVLGAFQEGAAASWWGTLGGVASLGGLVTAVSLRADLPLLVLLVFGSSTLVMLVATVWLFGFRKRWLAPRLSHFRTAQALALSRVGGDFLVIQLAGLVLFQSDVLVISRILGPAEVAGYSVSYRLFSFVLMGQALILGPLWPALTEAAARHDWGWVRSAFSRAAISTVAAVLPVVALLVVLARSLLQVWVGNDFAVPFELFVLLGVWTVLGAWGAVTATLMNALGTVRPQAVMASLMAAANLGLSIWWARSMGVTGVVSGTVVAYLAFSAIPQTIYVRWLLSRRTVETRASDTPT